MDASDTNRPFYLPRLPRAFYQSDSVTFWTMPVSHRKQGWLDDRFHYSFRELVLHTCARQNLFCPTYCLMPDHLHLMLMGLQPESDQLNGISFLRTHLKPVLAPAKFQHQAHDRVLPEKERQRGAFAATCHYMLDNPVRANLVTNPKNWPFYGAIIPGYPTLKPLTTNFWPTFWKIYFESRDPACAHRTLPPRHLS